MKINDLPNDIHSLKKMVLFKEPQLEEQESQLKEKSLDIKRKDRLIIDLQDALQLLRRKKFAHVPIELLEGFSGTLQVDGYDA